MFTRAIQLILSGALMATAAVALAETYTPINFPGAIVTDASGINSAGEIVGTYTDASNLVHGFRLDQSGFSTIDYPGAISTSAFAVNARGDIAGFFLDLANHWHGFVLSDGSYFVQDYPGATTGTFTLGIGPNGTLVGEFKTGQPFGVLGFAWIMRHGRYTPLTPPGSTSAFATSVNSRGDVVGRLIDGAGGQNAWALGKDGTYHVFQFPGAALTNARSINSKGEVVGVYRSDVNHGFVLPPNDFSNFVTIDFPGAVATRALGINSCGDIVGSYGSAAAGTGHGFLLVRDEAHCDDDE
jgi:uncharacterized membrane protein